ncbi:MAG TPA: alpha/beta hydrolase-fold protein [Mucilaginibacter sp.]|nr:alpha/beta hydrolase-fold protein [Mucilaginibacter sp.]
MTVRLKTLLLTLTVLFFSQWSSGQPLERYRQLKDTTYISKNLGYNKHIQITVPLEYQEDLKQNFPLIILFDIQNKRQYQYLLKSIDYLTANEQMPSAVIVGVEAGAGNKRYKETQLKISDTSCLGDNNEDYIFKELIPMMRGNFKAGQFTMLIGHSRYGFLTTYLLAKHFEELNAVISISPFMQQPQIDLTKLLTVQLGNADLKHTVYYRYAMGNDYPDDYKKLTTALKSPDFHPKRFDADGWWFPNADHNTTPALTITRALYEVFAYWHSCQIRYNSESNTSVSTIDDLKPQVADHYGASLNFSIGILNGKGNAFYNKGDYANAILAWQQLVAQYPNFLLGYLHIAKCQKELKQPTTQTMNAFKSNLPGSSIFTAEQKAGLLKEAEEFSLGKD